jgi:signal transduction histidine kinase
VVVLSGLADEGVAIQAVHDGAQDYLVKGNVDGATIVRSLRYAIERQRLETARLALERQRDEFFSSVSHDLRTPVASIKAAIGVVLANEPANMPPSLHRLLGNIDLAADELAGLIDDLLEVARLQAGRVELWKSDVELSSVVQRCIASMEPLFAARDQRLVLEGEGEAEVHVDVERFSRVLRNLLGNAQKYGREGGAVRVSIEPRDEAVYLAVADDGPGIAPEDHERVFERFHRLSTVAAGTPGSGLGLAIARGIVELHGGRLWVESSPGNGATFIISLPRT